MSCLWNTWTTSSNKFSNNGVDDSSNIFKILLRLLHLFLLKLGCHCLVFLVIYSSQTLETTMKSSAMIQPYILNLIRLDHLHKMSQGPKPDELFNKITHFLVLLCRVTWVLMIATPLSWVNKWGKGCRLW